MPITHRRRRRDSTVELAVCIGLYDLLSVIVTLAEHLIGQLGGFDQSLNEMNFTIKSRSPSEPVYQSLTSNLLPLFTFTLDQNMVVQLLASLMMTAAMVPPKEGHPPWSPYFRVAFPFAPFEFHG